MSNSLYTSWCRNRINTILDAQTGQWAQKCPVAEANRSRGLSKLQQERKGTVLVLGEINLTDQVSQNQFQAFDVWPKTNGVRTSRFFPRRCTALHSRSQITDAYLSAEKMARFLMGCQDRFLWFSQTSVYTGNDRRRGTTINFWSRKILKCLWIYAHGHLWVTIKMGWYTPGFQT